MTSGRQEWDEMKVSEWEMEKKHKHAHIHTIELYCENLQSLRTKKVLFTRFANFRGFSFLVFCIYLARSLYRTYLTYIDEYTMLIRGMERQSQDGPTKKPKRHCKPSCALYTRLTHL